jgi:hypothetical protein
MAEPIGLTIGGLSLTALFSTCVECMEYIHLGQNYGKDYELSLTKMILLKVRLNAWGESLRVMEERQELSSLRDRWLQEREMVGRCLVGIKSIFDDSSTLEKRYGLDRNVANGHQQGSELQRRESAALQQIEERFRFVAIGRQTDASLWKKTTWAIRDKKKFDSLISDLAFYVGGLENLSDRLNLLDLRRQILRGRIQQVTDRESMALLEDASSQSEGISRPIPGEDSDTPSSERTQGHVYLGTIIKDRARVLNGNAGIQGPGLSSHRYEGTQALDDASVVQGDMSEGAAMAFFRR